jgi:hypothetical protein
MRRVIYVICQVAPLCDVLIIRDEMMEAERTSETSVDNYFTRQYISEDNSEHCEMLSDTFPDGRS